MGIRANKKKEIIGLNYPKWALEHDVSHEPFHIAYTIQKYGEDATTLVVDNNDFTMELLENPENASKRVKQYIGDDGLPAYFPGNSSFVALFYKNKIIFTFRKDDKLDVALGMNFSVIDYRADLPVFQTKVVGVSYTDGPISRQVTIQQLAAYNSIQKSSFEVRLETGSKFDEFARRVLISAKVKDNYTLQDKMVGFLPKALSRILTIMEEWFSINYNVTVKQIRSNLTKGGKSLRIPCSVSLVLIPIVIDKKAPMVKSLNVSGMNISQVRNVLRKKEM